MAVIREARSSNVNLDGSSFNKRNQLTQVARQQLVTTLEKNFQKELQDSEFLDDVIKNLQTKEDVADFIDSAPEKMDFPFVIFTIALVVDILDISEFSGFAYFVTAIIKVLFTAIIWIWLLGKLNGLFRVGSRVAFKGSQSAVQQKAKTASKQFLRKYLSRRAVAIIIVNFIPVISILASWAFFIFLAYNRHNKLANAYIQAVSSIKINNIKKK